MNEGARGNQLSVVIPTFGREKVLVDALKALQALRPAPRDILVVDQTERHSREVEAALRTMGEVGAIRWIRGLTPCIPCAMNRGLIEATGDFALFLDDDIRPNIELVSAHRKAHQVSAESIFRCPHFVAGKRRNLLRSCTLQEQRPLVNPVGLTHYGVCVRSGQRGTNT